MNKHFRSLILITMALFVTISLVNAPAPIVLIGKAPQLPPYESSPTTDAYYGMAAPVLPGDMRDGDLDTNGRFTMGADTSLGTQTIRPDSDLVTQWTLIGAPNHYTAMQTNDGKTSCANITAIRKTELFGLTDLAVVGDPTSVTVRVYVQRASGATTNYIKLCLRIGGTYYNSSDISLAAGAYALKSSVWATNPATGKAWNMSEVNALQAGIISSTNTDTVRVSVTLLEVQVPMVANNAYYEIKGFKNTPTASFTIGFVDLKVKYGVPSALTNDLYRIEYTVGTGAPWIELQANTSAAYDRKLNPAIRPWANITEPRDNAWNFTDIGNLRLRIVCYRVAGAWDAKLFNIFEVWASVYPFPLPPTGMVGSTGAHLAVIPSAVYNVSTSQYFFVDIYVTNVTKMKGFEFYLLFDGTIVTPTGSFFIYDPFHYESPGGAPLYGDENGTWYFPSHFMPTGEAVGFTGSEPIARVYFQVDQWGMSPLNILNATEAQSLPSPYTGSHLYAIGPELPHTVHDGWFSSATRIMSYTGGLLSGDPTASPNSWHELYPTYSSMWTLTSWRDNDDGVLSWSDQIDMINETHWKHWFHVDAVTITLNYTYTGTTDKGYAEPIPLSIDSLPTDPTVIHWHEIYPTFCRNFTIDSYDDNDISGDFSIGDTLYATWMDTSETFSGTLDLVSTDIWISQKPIPPEYVPPVPEFPLGIGIIMTLAPIIPIVYLWRTRSKKTKRGE